MDAKISPENLIISLLTEELKSRRFFNTLMELGMDHSYFRPCLDDVILNLTGLADDTNETMEFFCATLDAHAQEIGIKEESVREQANAVYEKLISFRASRAKP